MSRYIYIEDDRLMDIAYEHMDDIALIGLQNALNEIPIVDVEPVVRCRDCRFAEPIKDSYGFYTCVSGLLVGENHFCSLGERSEDDEN